MNLPTPGTAAFIDMDYTLYKKYLYQALFTHHWRNNFKRWAVIKFIAFHFPIWLLYKAKLLSVNFFYKLHATNLAWLLKGVSLERAEKIWDWVIENEITPCFRSEMIAKIDEHKIRGHRIFLISGSFTPLLDKLAVKMGIEGSIATPLETQNGRFTGKIIPPLNVGEGKVVRLSEFIETDGNTIDLDKSYFYTDSIVDAPVLELFGNPVVVYPDELLSVLAEVRDWPMIGGPQ